MEQTNPRQHQRDVGEKEHVPHQAQQPSGQEDDLQAKAREKANKNNTHRNEQTGHAMAAARTGDNSLGQTDAPHDDPRPRGAPDQDNQERQPGDSNRMTGNRGGGQRND